jgi:predicted transposase
VRLVKTIKIKLDVKAEALLPTIEAYTNSFNYVCDLGFSKKISNSIELHKLSYNYIRTTFNLPAQLACSSYIKASEALNALRKKKWTICPKSKQQSIRYDKNSLSIFLDKSIVSLLTIKKRLKCKMILSKYHEEYFQNWKHSSADLVVQK